MKESVWFQWDGCINSDFKIELVLSCKVQLGTISGFPFKCILSGIKMKTKLKQIQNWKKTNKKQRQQNKSQRLKILVVTAHVTEIFDRETFQSSVTNVTLQNKTVDVTSTILIWHLIFQLAKFFFVFSSNLFCRKWSFEIEQISVESLLCFLEMITNLIDISSIFFIISFDQFCKDKTLHFKFSFRFFFLVFNFWETCENEIKESKQWWWSSIYLSYATTYICAWHSSTTSRPYPVSEVWIESVMAFKKCEQIAITSRSTFTIFFLPFLSSQKTNTTQVRIFMFQVHR